MSSLGITKKQNTRILDACCGSRMFWFDRENPDTTYMDIRDFEDTLCDGRTLTVHPDIVADFRDIPFEDESFSLVVFDPPHLKSVGETSWMAKKYGKLSDCWQDDLMKGFSECFRVLKQDGVLVFKWNEDQIKAAEVLKLVPYKPLFGDRRSKTHWMVFMKPNNKHRILV